MAYIGRALVQGNYVKLDDLQSQFDGSTTTFNLKSGGAAYTPGSANTLLVSLGGVIQEPIEAFTVTNDQITFTTAPTAGTDIFIVALGAAVSIGTPADGSVTGAKLSTPFNYVGVISATSFNSVGVNTAQAGLQVGALASIGATISASGNATFAGVVTATSFSGNATGLSGTPNITVGILTATSAIVGSAVTINASGINAAAGVGTFNTLKVGTGVTISAGVITATNSITIGSTDVLTAISAKASTGKAIAMAIVFG